ncbi:MAG: family 16 glycoside hydrolase [Phycisphaerae bacterium]
MMLRTTLIGLAALVAMSTRLSAQTINEEFRFIFDGKTLNGWDGDPVYWRVEDGAITGQTTPDKPLKHNTFLIWRHGEVDDFELVLEYRILGGNSGIQYRSWEDPDKWGKWVAAGEQADIDATNKYTGILYSERSRGILAQRGQKVVIGEDHKPKVVGTIGTGEELAAKIRDRDWNSYRVVARGNRYVHEINGQVMIEAIDEDHQAARRSGILALQLHVGEPMVIQFRNIRLKRLPMEGKKKIVFVAGTASHGYGSHEHHAGCTLLAKLLNENLPAVHAVVYRNGWPADPTAFDNANAMVFFADGAGGNMINSHLGEIEAAINRGAGLAVLHYALDVPRGPVGERMLKWIGGYFEQHWSVNPHWTARFTHLPDHPITRGVRPFEIEDEWYYHMRFRENMENVAPILSAVPPEETRERPDGPYSGNPHVRARKGMPEIVAWAFERSDGGRGFGFTGGHFQWNWGHDDYRKLMLNALTWVAGAEVPPGGVPSKTPTFEELDANQDEPRPADFKVETIRAKLSQWQAATGPS